MRLSGLLYFSAGVAAGATGRAAYPKVKETLAPLAAAALAGASHALADAVDAAKTAAADIRATAAAVGPAASRDTPA
jgi:hypothetical protein